MSSHEDPYEELGPFKSPSVEKPTASTHAHLSEATDKELFMEFVKRIPKPSEDVLQGTEFLEIDNTVNVATEVKINLNPPIGEYISVLFKPDGSIIEISAVCY